MEIRGQLCALTALPAGKSPTPPCTQWIGSWVDPRASLDDMEKRKILAIQLTAHHHTGWAMQTPYWTLPFTVHKNSEQWKLNTNCLFIQQTYTVVTSCKSEYYNLAANSCIWISRLFIIREEYIIIYFIYNSVCSMHLLQSCFLAINAPHPIPKVGATSTVAQCWSSDRAYLWLCLLLASEERTAVLVPL
jgi:hypothetical protein